MSDEMAGTPSDHTTLSEVLDHFRDDGFTGDFEVLSEDQIRCVSCGQTSDPNQVTAQALRRLEGASDPDDMLAVHGVTCPRCEARAALVLGYGPNASPAEAGVGRALRDRRGHVANPG